MQCEQKNFTSPMRSCQSENKKKANKEMSSEEEERICYIYSVLLIFFVLFRLCDLHKIY